MPMPVFQLKELSPPAPDVNHVLLAFEHRQVLSLTILDLLLVSAKTVLAARVVEDWS
jgi:hypothetical protein